MANYKISTPWKDNVSDNVSDPDCQFWRFYIMCLLLKVINTSIQNSNCRTCLFNEFSIFQFTYEQIFNCVNLACQTKKLVNQYFFLLPKWYLNKSVDEVHYTKKLTLDKCENSKYHASWWYDVSVLSRRFSTVYSRRSILKPMEMGAS